MVTTPLQPIFRRDELMSLVSGDHGLLRELITLFTESARQQLRAIRRSVDSIDFRAMERAAHALKGSVSNFRSPQTVASLQRLETAAMHADLQEARQALAESETLLQRLSAALQDLARRT